MNKGLEALKRVKWGIYVTPEERLKLCEYIEKELKALEVIKKKQVNMFSLLSSIEWFNPSHYNDSIGCPVGCELTQEEYDLLKEVFNK